MNTSEMFDFEDGKGPVPAHKHSNGGGWVANTASVDSTAYIGPSAMVYGNAKVYGDAKVYGNARVFGNARVYGDAWVCGNARVCGDSWVSDNAMVYGNAEVSGNARVYGNARVFENAEVSGDARVSENARVSGDAEVSDNARVSGDARVSGNAWVYGNAKVFGDAMVRGNFTLGGAFVLDCGIYEVPEDKETEDIPEEPKVLHDYMNFVESLWEPSKGGGLGYSAEQLTDILRAVLGFQGEVGELLEKFKKYFRGDYGDTFPREDIEKEMGDAMYYFFVLMLLFDIDPYDVLQGNIDKLTSRKERGVILGSGDNR